MCDYSLENVASRPAVTGDKLVTTLFRFSVTLGLAAVSDRTTAVCLRPGTELAFDAPPRHSRRFFFGSQVASGCVARFRQIDLGIKHAHHDALEFPDGSLVLVAKLLPDQFATVLQLPVEEGNMRSVPVETRSQRPTDTILMS
jgi:hypothetical protein